VGVTNASISQSAGNSNGKPRSDRGVDKVPFRPDFIKVDYAIFVDPDLSHAAKLLFARLKFYAGCNGKANPKHATLAREMCMGARQVRRVLDELKTLNRIDWKRSRIACIFTIKPPEDWTKMSTLDRTKMSHQTGQKRPIEKRFKKRSSSKEDSKTKNSGQRTTRTAGGGYEGTANPPNPTKPSLKADDDENPKTTPTSYTSPEAELRGVYREKAGHEITRDVERRIWEAVELRGRTRQNFIEQLRSHTPNTWTNPAGFLTNFARQIATVSTREPERRAAPQVQEPPTDQHGRCAECGGGGYKAANVYCTCAMGREVQCVEERKAKLASAPTVAQAETSMIDAQQPAKPSVA
jgi:hypothetical protein